MISSAASHLDTDSPFSVSTEELFDENNHLGLLDGTGVVLVESAEDLIESFLGELITGSEVSEGVLDELLGLFLVEGTGFVDIIGVPDLVDDALDSLFFRSCHFLLCIWLKINIVIKSKIKALINNSISQISK